ncbi:gephyrin-like molybdotransferase Glp [Candidatus Halocynthiibacter alkanivorans]|uniref:molybdopterin molybdotransferase MoeA n=1 Tax=Candidatus Halocynthiibacter alkanivorans TaxID=2267619 RepID=UPI000DF18C83|nr:gephyrin-like molybdotransferase Glp [Candidatus Halocynthiibacter alkanivorans]
MISVSEALDHIFSLCTPLDAEDVPLHLAAGRTLARSVTARRSQPPFAASAMDGYAVKEAEVASGASFTVVGEAAAGHGWHGTLKAGQALRIFTGAPLPAGADRVVIQEDVSRQGNNITLNADLDQATYVRPAGADFSHGDSFPAPKILSAQDVALLASMNIDRVPVSRKPVVAIIATGDELVMPGETPGPDQIIASNNFGLQAMCQAAGADTRLLPIARDNEASLRAVFELTADADIVVTSGGASVGDHDLVAQVATDMGLERRFWKLAMRPGKPLMAGRLGNSMMIGLPGNPVSSLVCARIFIIPAIRRLLGHDATAETPLQAPLSEPVAENGVRAHYMRAIIDPQGIRALPRQDSALLSVLSQANALLLRPPFDAARKAGEMVPYLPL